MLGLKVVGHKLGAGNCCLQPRRESLPEEEDNTELRGSDEVLVISSELFNVILEARIYFSDFVSSMS